MGWLGHLQLNYRRDGARTIVHDRHRGPLRILRSLYPESEGICHNVLVHPPGGVVGGDVLELELELRAGSHALLTTPGATRFYRSAGESAQQSLRARLGEGARLEWLPLETICHRSALAENRMRFELAAGAEMIGWDLLALGLPASGEAFDHGCYTQQIELAGVWLERGIIDGSDTRLLDSPLGFAGYRVMATMWFGAGQPLDAARTATIVDATRELLAADPLDATSAATVPNDQMVVVRVLAAQVEPAMALLTRVWARWRELAWALPASPPRVWRT